MNRTAIAIVAFALTACSGGTEPQPVAETSVTIANASRQSPTPTSDRITLTATNSGGPGSYKLEFWSWNLNEINGPDRLIAATEAVTVTTGYRETVTWTVTRSGYAPTERVVVLSRSQNSAIYRETGRVTF